MAIYTIRPEFTIVLPSGTFLGGEQVDLSPEEFQLHKHKLEGIEDPPIPDQSEGGGGNSECCYPAPSTSKISPLKVALNSNLTLEVEGSFFAPDMTVEVEGCTVTGLEFISDNLIKVDLTVGSTLGLSDLTVNNGQETVVEDALEIFDFAAGTVDFRLGGSTFNNSAIRTRFGLAWSRTNDGLSVSKGSISTWGAWVKFVGENDSWVWDRSEKRNLAFIIKPDQGMIGIGSNELNENSNAQYTQAEILGYFTRSTSFGRFYGNTGTPGQGTTQSATATIPANTLVKFVLEHNGEAGYNYYLYSLPQNATLSDWYDTSTLLATGQIASSFTADAAEIMPFFIASRTGFLILGFYFF
ncbi:MAG: hypothetical protein QNJ53_14680 [Pleurocapsa sp. MO_192.B19]|nr:hypothetical protein [Pleurocapsa sp. MO_192.B19]